MSPQERYDSAVFQATDCARKIKGDRAKIPYSMWFCFQPLYSEMLKRKEIEPLRELPEETKHRYWAEAKAALPCKIYKLIWICQSLFLYDLITSNE